MKRVALLAMTIALACAPAVWAGSKANTKVTIDSAFLAPGETQWAGDIFSPRRACKNQRLVLIFRVRPGADQRIGSTRSKRGISNPGYFWTHSKPGAAPAGLYYVKVKPTAACQGDRSGNERLSY